jgi:hypothetical protein
MLPGAKGGRWRRIRFKNLDSPVIIFFLRAPTVLHWRRRKGSGRRTEFLAGTRHTIYSQSAPDPRGRGGPGQKGHSRPTLLAQKAPPSADWGRALAFGRRLICSARVAVRPVRSETRSVPTVRPSERPDVRNHRKLDTQALRQQQQRRRRRERH